MITWNFGFTTLNEKCSDEYRKLTVELSLQKLVTHLIASFSRAACTGTQVLTKQVTCINLPKQDKKHKVSNGETNLMYGI